MDRYLAAAMAAMLFSPCAGLAKSSPFDGTWKMDVGSAQWPQKPDVYLLAGGMDECKSCVPPIRVKADGKDHPVSGHPYFDSLAITVVDQHTIKRIARKAGKIVTRSTTIIAPDGKSLTSTYTDTSYSTVPVTGTVTEVRVAASPPGAHPISGAWRLATAAASDNNLITVYHVDGATLKMTSRTGQSFYAKMDGTEAPYNGDPGQTSVVIRKIDGATFEETDKRGAKIIGIATTKALPDGKTLAVTYVDKLHDTTMSFKDIRQ